MTKHRLVLLSCFLTVLTLQMLGCGGSNMNSNRVLQSMVITPANADAQNFSNGQVQFTATGTFSQAPSPAKVTFQSPYTGTWSLMGSGAGSVATIDQTGLAQCIPGAAGKVTVSAIVSANSTNAPAMSIAVTATTTLTCP